MLENVIIGRNVKYAQGIDFGSGVQFVTQGFGIDRFGDFMPTRTDFLGNIRTQKQRHANGIKLSRNIASTVQIKNKLFIEAEHVGESAEFLIVCYYKSATRSIAYMRDENNWKVWDGEVGSLQAAAQYDSLPEKMEIIVFEGDLSEMPGTFTLFSGYRLDRSQSIIYNGDEPIRFFVINQSGFFGE